MSRLTLAAYAARWLASVAVSISPRTLRVYEIHFRLRILPTLGAVRLTALRRREIRFALKGMLQNGHGPSVVRNSWIALASCLNAAVEDDLLNANPAHGAARGLFPPIRNDGDAKALTRERAMAALRAVEDHDPALADFFWTKAGTGLRIGEMLALRPEHVDAANRCLYVRGQYIDGATALPKGGRTRTVDLSLRLADRLAARVRALPPGAVYLFQSTRRRPTRPWSSWYIRRRFYRALERANLPKSVPHQWRHTFATMLLEETGDLVYVSRALGHADVNVTAGLYGRGAKPRHLPAVDRYDAALHGERLGPRPVSFRPRGVRQRA